MQILSKVETTMLMLTSKGRLVLIRFITREQVLSLSLSLSLCGSVEGVDDER